VVQLLSFIDFHASVIRSALSHFAMPAMSPTMTEGGIAGWKKAEGESFSAGDVLLEIVDLCHYVDARWLTCSS
jgi:Biotin-requiring enzyme